MMNNKDKNNFCRLSLCGILAVVLLSACSNDETGSEMTGKPISVSVGVDEADEMSVTRGTNADNFDNGDIIYVGKTNSAGQRKDPRNEAYPPVPYTYGSADGIFTGDLTWDQQNECLYAFRRGDGGATLTTDFTIPSDQSMYNDGNGKGIICADFLYSPERQVYFNNNETPTCKLNNFTHSVSKLKVVVTIPDGGSNELLQECLFCYGVRQHNSSIAAQRLYMSASVSTSGVLTKKGEQNGQIKMFHRPGTNYFECYVIPGNAIQLADIGLLIVKYNDKTYYYSRSSQKTLTFEAGKVHTITFNQLIDKASQE